MKAYRIKISYPNGNTQVLLEPELVIDSLNVDDPIGFYLRSLGFEQNLSPFGHYGWVKDGTTYANWSLVELDKKDR